MSPSSGCLCKLMQIEIFGIILETAIGFKMRLFSYKTPSHVDCIHSTELHTHPVSILYPFYITSTLPSQSLFAMQPYTNVSVSLQHNNWRDDPEKLYVEFLVRDISVFPSGDELHDDRMLRIFKISPNILDDKHELFEKLKIMASYVSLDSYPLLLQEINNLMLDVFMNCPLGNNRLIKIEVDSYTNALIYEDDKDEEEEVVIDEEVDEAWENLMEQGFGGVPSSTEFIENLSVSKYEGVQRKKEGCSICMDDFVAGAGVTSLPCAHLFHGECVVPWLERSNVCPLCRTKMPIDN